MGHNSGTDGPAAVMMLLSEIMLCWYFGGVFARYVARRRPQDTVMREILSQTEWYDRFDRAILVGALLLGMLALAS